MLGFFVPWFDLLENGDNETIVLTAEVLESK
jgi:hypothetical protein